MVLQANYCHDGSVGCAPVLGPGWDGHGSCQSGMGEQWGARRESTRPISSIRAGRSHSRPELVLLSASKSFAARRGVLLKPGILRVSGIMVQTPRMVPFDADIGRVSP